jgi:hypothetical protein
MVLEQQNEGNMRIIGLHGRKGVGKNFVAAILGDVLRQENTQDCSPSFVVKEISFADPIKHFCTDVLLLDKENLYGNDKAKNALTKYKWENMPEYIRDKNRDKSGYMSHRHVMQIFGTEFTRDVWNKNIWTDVVKHRIDNGGCENVLITDVRFQNEIDEIHSWGGQVWRIEGPNRSDTPDRWLFNSPDAHESEKAVDSTVRVDAVIRNGWEDNKETIAAQVRKALGIQ